MNGLANPLAITTMALASVSLAKEKNFIKENWKPILGIGAAIGATYVVWSIYRDITDKPTPGGLDELPQYSTSTLSPAEAQAKADRLFIAMKTLGKVNEEELNEIRTVLQGLTYNDFIKVSQAFGDKRYVSLTGLPQTWPAPERSLVYWLTNELETTDLNALRQVIPNVF